MENDSLGKLSFKQLPVVAKVGVTFAFFDAWLWLERIVIEPTGLYRYMPGYSITDACVWDLTVAILIVAGLWLFPSWRWRGVVRSAGMNG